MKTTYPDSFFYLMITALLIISCDKDPQPTTCKELEMFHFFEYSGVEIAPGSKITFTDKSSGDYLGRKWYFQGATPEWSSLEEVTVTYGNTGSFDVILQHFNDCDTLSLVGKELVQVSVSETPDTTDNYLVTPMVYGNDDRYHKFWFYEMKSKSQLTQPVILIFAGGGFRWAGDFKRLDGLAKALINQGFKVALLNHYFKNYPIDPTDKQRIHRMFMANHSVKAAVRYFRKYADSLNVNSDQIVVGGYSSGAIASLMSTYFGPEIINDQILSELNDNGLTINGGYEGDQGNPGYSSIPAACIGLAGQIPTINGTKLSGILSSDKPPLFGVCAENDTEVNCDISESVEFAVYGANAYVDSARTYGLCAEKYIFEGGNHQTPYNDYEKYVPKLVAFLEDVFDGTCEN